MYGTVLAWCFEHFYFSTFYIAWLEFAHLCQDMYSTDVQVASSPKHPESTCPRMCICAAKGGRIQIGALLL